MAGLNIHWYIEKSYYMRRMIVIPKIVNYHVQISCIYVIYLYNYNYSYYYKFIIVFIIVHCTLAYTRSILFTRVPILLVSTLLFPGFCIIIIMNVLGNSGICLIYNLL